MYRKDFNEIPLLVKISEKLLKQLISVILCVSTNKDVRLDRSLLK